MSNKRPLAFGAMVIVLSFAALISTQVTINAYDPGDPAYIGDIADTVGVAIGDSLDGLRLGTLPAWADSADVIDGGLGSGNYGPNTVDAAAIRDRVIQQIEIALATLDSLVVAADGLALSNLNDDAYDYDQRMTVRYIYADTTATGVAGVPKSRVVMNAAGTIRRVEFF